MAIRIRPDARADEDLAVLESLRPAGGASTSPEYGENLDAVLAKYGSYEAFADQIGVGGSAGAPPRRVPSAEPARKPAGPALAGPSPQAPASPLGEARSDLSPLIEAAFGGDVIERDPVNLPNRNIFAQAPGVEARQPRVIFGPDPHRGKPPLPGQKPQAIVSGAAGAEPSSPFPPPIAAGPLSMGGPDQGGVPDPAPTIPVRGGRVPQIGEQGPLARLFAGIKTSDEPMRPSVPFGSAAGTPAAAIIAEEDRDVGAAPGGIEASLEQAVPGAESRGGRVRHRPQPPEQPLAKPGRVKLPDGRTVKIPAGLTPSQVRTALQRQFPEFYQGKLGAMGAGFAQGFDSAIATGAKGIDALLYGLESGVYKIERAVQEVPNLPPEDVGKLRQWVDRKFANSPALRNVWHSRISDQMDGSAAELEPNGPTLPQNRAAWKFGEHLEEFAQREYPIEPQHQGQWYTDIAQGAGSTSAMALVGLVSPELLAASGALMGAGEAASEAHRAGASPAQIADAARLGTIPGVIDTLPIDYMLMRFTRNPGLRGWLINFGRRTLEQAGVEGTTEAVQQFLQNLIAKSGWQPGQELTEGMLHAFLIGAGVGVPFGGVGAVMDPTPVAVQAPPMQAPGTQPAAQPGSNQGAGQPGATPPGSVGTPAQPAPGAAAAPGTPPVAGQPPAAPISAPPAPPAASAPSAPAQPPGQAPQSGPSTGAPQGPAPAAPQPAPAPAPTGAVSTGQPLPGAGNATPPAHGGMPGASPGVPPIGPEGAGPSVSGAPSAQPVPGASDQTVKSPEQLAAEAAAQRQKELEDLLNAADETADDRQRKLDDRIASGELPGSGQRARIYFPDTDQEELLSVGDYQQDGKGGWNVTLNDDRGFEVYNGPIEGVEFRGSASGAGTPKVPLRNPDPAEIDAANGKINQTPTAGQAEAGNYKQTHVKFDTPSGVMEIAIETPKGGTRRDVKEGKWEVPNFPAHYGRWKGTKGADGDELDVVVGPKAPGVQAWVIDQIDPATGKFDEHKIMLGFESREDAIAHYVAMFNDGSGRSRIGGVSADTITSLWGWARNEAESKQPRSPELRQQIDAQAQAQAQIEQHRKEEEARKKAEEKARRDAEKAAAEAEDEARRQQYGTPQKPNRSALARVFAERFLDGGSFKTIIEARRFAGTFLGGMPEAGTAAVKDVDEAIEIGVVIAARQIVREYRKRGVAEKFIFKELVDLYNRQPNLGSRTSTSAVEQAYSTPVPIAYLASRLAGVTSSDTVLEPTAGNGMLLLEVEPDKAVTNELNGDRASALTALGFRPTGADASKPGTFANEQVDVILANPPFGKVVDRGRVQSQDVTRSWSFPRLDGKGKWETKEVDHAISLEALKALKENGRAVLIIGSKKGATDKARTEHYRASQVSRAFFLELYGRYNVVDHFSVDGDLYSRQGAGWPIDIIVIEGHGKSSLPLPSLRVPRLLRSFDELEGVLNGRRQAAPNTGSKDGPRVAPAEGGRVGSDSGSGAAAGRPPHDQSGHLPEPTRPQAGEPDGSGGRDGGSDVSTPQPAPVPGERGDAGNVDTAPAGEGVPQPQPGSTATPPVSRPVRQPAGEDRGAESGRPDDAQANKPARVPGRPDSPSDGRVDAGAISDLSADDFDALVDAEVGTTPVVSTETPKSETQRTLPPAQTPTDPETGEDLDRPMEGPQTREEQDKARAKAAQVRKRRPKGSIVKDLPENYTAADLKKRLGLPESPKPTDAPTEDKGLTDLLAEAGKEGVKGADEALTALFKALGGGSSTVGSGFVFSEEGYQKAKPHLKASIESFIKAGKSLADAIRFILDKFTVALQTTREEVGKLLKRFKRDLDSGEVKLESAPKKRELAKDLKETALQVAYPPLSKVGPIGTLTPANQRDASIKARESLTRDVGENIDEWVADKLGWTVTQLGDRLGAEQVDGVALAIWNIEKGAAVVIGDQTGIGKGRMVAALMIYAKRSGRTPVFFTESAKLYADMMRDTKDIGWPDFKPLITNNGLTGAKAIVVPDGRILRTTSKQSALLTRAIKENSLLGHDAIFTTYSQLSPWNANRTVRHDLLDHFADSAILILDEAHEAGGQGSDKPKRPKRMKDGRVIAEPWGVSDYVRGLLEKVQGAYYSSATWAKRPQMMDLYSRTDMRLAVKDLKDLGMAIANGGVPLQQAVSNMLTEAGQYLRRERSFDGVDYKFHETAVDQKAASRFSALLKDVLDFDLFKWDRLGDENLVDELHDLFSQGEDAITDQSTGEAGVGSTHFTSLMHNLISQMLLASKVDQAVELALEARKEGKKPVITVANTMGAFIEDYADMHGIKPGEPINVDFRELLLRYLEKSREVTFGSAYGEKKRIRLSDEHLGPRGVALYERVKKEIETSDAIAKMPASPIDYMHMKLRAAGLKSGEITGRAATIDYTDPTTGATYRRRGADEISDSGKVRNVTAFNSGELDVLIINQSGATGLSLHASESFKDKSRRRMIIAQAEADINIHMQMLGRVHRTGQVIPPEYFQLVADIPAELRPAAVLQKKMASLNANTTSARKSDFSDENAPDFMNEYGDLAVTSILSDDEDLNRHLGFPLKQATRQNAPFPLDETDAARKVTGRIPLLPIEQQRELYDRIVQEYKDLLARMDALGENALEAKTLELDAKPLSELVIFEGDANNPSPFARSASLIEYDVKRLGKPHKRAEVEAMVSEALNLEGNVEPLALKAGGRVKMGERLDAGRRAFTEYLDKALAEYDTEVEESRQRHEKKRADAIAAEKEDPGEFHESPAARENFQNRLVAVRTKWEGLLSRYVEGQTIKIKSNDGNLYGVITKIERKGKTKNPLALGTWRVTIAIADATRSLTLPLSQLTTAEIKSDSDSARYELEPATQMVSAMVAGPDGTLTPKLVDIWENFDLNQSEGAREKRLIMTGNLLAGFSRTEGKKATIITFRDHDGTLRPGILMGRTVEAGDVANYAPVPLENPDHIEAFLADFEHSVSTEDKQLEIRVTQEAARRGSEINVKITAPSQRATGGKWWGNPNITRVTGDWVKSGSQFVLKRPVGELATLIRLLQREGAKFYAHSHKDKARKVAGIPEPKKKQKNDAERASLTADAVGVMPEFLPVLKQLIRQINPDVKVAWVERLFAKGEGAKASGAPDANTAVEASGVYNTLYNVIKLSLAKANVSVAAHEAWHSIEDLLTSQELKLLRAAYPSTEIAAYERTAYAFGDWVEGKIKDGKIPAGVLPIFRKIKNLLTKIRNWWRGHGFQTIEDVFDRGLTGEIAARGQKKIGDRIKDVPEIRGDLIEALERHGYAAAEIDKLTFNEARNILAEREIYTRANSYALPTPKPMTPEEQALLTDLGQRKEATDPFWKRWRAALAKREELITAAKRRLRQGFFDKFDSLAHYEKLLRGQVGDALISAWKTALRTQNIRGVMLGVLRFGPPMMDADGNIVVRRGFDGGLEKIFVDLYKNGLLEQFKLYAIAYRAQRLHAEGREKLMAKIAAKHGITTDQAIQKGLDLATRHPELESARQQWVRFNSAILDFVEQAGVVNAEQRAAWENSDYIPFYRVLEDEEVAHPSRTAGIANQRSGIRELKGGEAVLNDVLDNIMLNTTYLVDAAYKNIAMQRTVALLAGTGVITPERSAKFAKALVPATSAKKALENAGVTVDALDAKQRRSILLAMQIVSPKDHDVVSVMVNGKPRYYKVHDKLLLASLTSLNDRQIGWLKPFGKAKRLFTHSITADPTFIVTNLIRDTMHTRILLGSKDHGKLTDPLVGFRDALGLQDKDLAQLLIGGGSSGGFWSDAMGDLSNLEKRARRNARKLTDVDRHALVDNVSKGWELWERVGFASENANRLAVYRAAKRQGKSTAEAVHMAQDLLNFSMRGDFVVVQALAETVPFLNARLQGLYRMGRQLSDPMTRKGALIRLGIATVLGVAYWGLNAFNEDYQDLEDWDRESYYHFWIGGQHWRLPKPFEIGMITATWPEALLNAAVVDGDWRKAMSTIFVRGLFETMALNPVGNPIVQTALEEVFNFNLFLEAPIIPQGLENVDKEVPEMAFRHSTSDTAKVIGELFNVSPLRVEHTIRGLFGTMGKYFLAASSPAARILTGAPAPAETRWDELPIVGRFYREDPAFSTRWISDFYDIHAAASGAYTAWKTAKDIDPDKAKSLEQSRKVLLDNRKMINRVYRDMGDLNKEMKAVALSRKLTPEQKLKAMNELRVKLQAKAKEIKPVYEQLH